MSYELVWIGFLLASVVANPPAVGGQIRQQDTISLEGAIRVADAAMAQARRKNASVTIVVIDAGANVVLTRRMDGAPLASIDLAEAKAETAVRLRVSTGALEHAVTKGAVALLSIPGLVASAGGIPIQGNGKILGAVAVSGASSGELDEEIAHAGMAILFR